MQISGCTFSNGFIDAVRVQGKRWGDPGANIDTIEPAEVLQARLLSFWDSHFPSPPNPSMSSPRQVLVVSHGGSIRQLVSALLMSRSFELDLPLEHQLEGTSRRVANCAITEMIMDEVLVDGGELGRTFLSYRKLTLFCGRMERKKAVDQVRGRQLLRWVVQNPVTERECRYRGVAVVIYQAVQPNEISEKGCEIRQRLLCAGSAS